MVKKGAVVAFFSAFFFLLAALLFLNNSVQEDRHMDLYFDVVESFEKGRECKLFIEKSAELVSYDSLDEHKKITRDFNNIEKYLVVFNSVCGSNLVYTDFEVDEELSIPDPYKRIEKVYVFGNAKKEVSFDSGNMTYSFYPHFDVVVFK